MIIKENESLANYTTFRMGGQAEKIYFPENPDELIQLLNEKPALYKYVISGGSNLLINDRRDFPEVLCMKNANDCMEHRGEGVFYIGASVRVQKAIKFINSRGFGGIEYLYSLPALMGGIIYMNAGRGRALNQSISDYIVSIDYLEDGTLKTINKEDCNFSYRTSVFQSRENCIIVGGVFRFPEMSEEESAQKIKERVELCKGRQDMSAPNYGSVFCSFNKYIMKCIQKIGIGKKSGCHFSKKTINWMLNGENGSFEEAMALIKRVKLFHKFIGKKCKTEVVIWE